MLKKILFTLSLCTTLSSCSINPVTGRNEFAVINEQTEIQLGSEAFVSMQDKEGGKYTEQPSIEEYVKSVGAKLVAVSDRPNLPFEFVVLKNDVPNAWTLPGGKIAINTGLLEKLNSEAELAAVLSHEIVHAAARHSAQQIEKSVLLDICSTACAQAAGNPEHADEVLKIGSALVILKYSRDHELEADAYGMKYMSKAGYDVQAAVSLQEMFLTLSDNKDCGWLTGLLATHPPSKERIKANKKTAKKYPAGGYIGAENYKSRTAPLKLK